MQPGGGLWFWSLGSFLRVLDARSDFTEAASRRLCLCLPWRELSLSLFTKTKLQCTSKSVVLRCCNNGWEIFMNEAVKLLKLLVLGICSPWKL